MARLILQKSGGKIGGVAHDNYRDFDNPVTAGSLHLVIVITHDNAAVNLNGIDAPSYVALTEHIDASGGGDRRVRAFYRKNHPGGVPALSDNAGATMAVYSIEYEGLPEDVATDPFIAEAFQDGSASSAPSVPIDLDVPGVIAGVFGDWNDGGFTLDAGAAYTEEDDAIANRGTMLESRLDAPSGPQDVDFVMTDGPKSGWSVYAIAFASGESEATTEAPTTPEPTTPEPTTPEPTTPEPTTEAPTTPEPTTPEPTTPEPTTPEPTTPEPTTEPPAVQTRARIFATRADPSPLLGGRIR